MLLSDFFSLPSYLLQQNYFLDFTHFNIEELDLTDQRFFWNRNVVNWRRDHFLLWIVCISVRGKVIGNFTFSRGKKVGNVTPHSNGKYVLPRNNIKRIKGTFMIYIKCSENYLMNCLTTCLIMHTLRAKNFSCTKIALLIWKWFILEDPNFKRQSCPPFLHSDALMKLIMCLLITCF